MKKYLFLLATLLLMLCFSSCTKEDETKGDSSVILQDAMGGDASNLSEEEAWKKEPMYGKDSRLSLVSTSINTTTPRATTVSLSEWLEWWKATRFNIARYTPKSSKLST